MPLSFDQSGSGAVSCGPMTLPEVQQLCCDCGFVKAGVAESKPLVLRADTAAFFKTLGVNSLSAFRELFYNSRVAQPKPGQAPPPPAPKKQAAAPAVRALRPLRACQSASLVKDLRPRAGVERRQGQVSRSRREGVRQPGGVVRKPQVARHPAARRGNHGANKLDDDDCFCLQHSARTDALPASDVENRRLLQPVWCVQPATRVSWS